MSAKRIDSPDLHLYINKGHLMGGLGPFVALRGIMDDNHNQERSKIGLLANDVATHLK